MLKLHTKKKNVLLISVRPQYASQIFGGSKLVELRRTRPRVEKGDVVLIYVSSPTMALVGYGTVAKVLSDSPKRLWQEIGYESGLSKSEFHEYFEGASIGFGIRLSKVSSLNDPVALAVLREKWDNFHPPQIYRYFSCREVAWVGADDHKLEAMLG